MLIPSLLSNQSSLCGFHSGRNRGGGGPDGPIIIIKRATDESRLRRKEIIDKNREKNRAKNGSLWKTSMDSKGVIFVILINHASALVRKKRLSPSKQNKNVG